MFLRLMTCLMAAGIGLLSFVTGRRQGHRVGVGARGRLVVEENPEFPAHPFFRPGREFKVVLRHANAFHEDDFAIDTKGASLALFDGEEPVYDILLNTGTNAWPNLRIFILTLMTPRRWLLWFFPRFDPGGLEVRLDTRRKSIDCYTDQMYHSYIPFLFTASDGGAYGVKFRLRSEGHTGESGLLREDDRAELIHKGLREDRPAGEFRAKNALREQFKAKVRSTELSVRYELFVQLKEVVSDRSDPMYGARAVWAEDECPWLKLACLEMDEVLDDDTTEDLGFRFPSPDGLGLCQAQTWTDGGSIGYARSRIYPAAQWARRLRRRMPF